MLDGFKILTVTHREVSLKDLQSFIVNHHDEQILRSKLQVVKEQFELQELLYVPTCNRVLYLFYKNTVLDNEFIQSFFQAINPNLDKNLILPRVNVYEGKEAILHIYEVASSIDSLVVGEREIFRQIRESYTQCCSWKLTGDNIRLLMKHLVQATKAVYTNTRIGEKPISVVSLAMHLLKQRKLSKDARVLLIGAGQTNSLVAKFLHKEGYHKMTFFNRTLEKAHTLAKTVGGQAHTLQALPDYTEGFDCLIVCTGATHAIIDISLYAQLLGSESDAKVVIDLSIPNNVSKTVVERFPIDYIDIEELRELAKLNLSLRKREIGLAKMLLKKKIKEFEQSYKGRQIERMMETVPSQIKAIKQKALEEVFKKELDQVDENARTLIEKMMTYMEKKCISIPMKAAKTLVRE